MTRYDAELLGCILSAGRLDAADAPVDAPDDLHFDSWTFRRHPCELLKAGVRVRLQEQPLHVLEALLQTPGELVTRDHLIGRLWPKRIVEFDAALNAAVRRLRATLCDEAETPRYIETVPRRGYRFIGEVRSRNAPPSPLRPARIVPRAGIAIAMATIVLSAGIAAAWTWHKSAAHSDAADNAPSSEAMVRAKFFMQRRHPGDLERATQEYERALSLSPNFAQAWAGIASVHWLEIAEGLQPREATLPKVRDAAQRALSLDPRLVEAHLRMAAYLRSTGQHAVALEHSKRAAELDPNNPLVLGAHAGRAADEGRWDEAIALQRRAVAAEPLSLVGARNLGYFLFLAGRIEDAKTQFIKVLELDPNQPNEINAFSEILDGRYEQALRIVETWPKGAERDHSLALIYHGLGRDQEATDSLDSLKTAKIWASNMLVAEVYAYQGEIEEAFRWLERVDAGNPQDSQALLYASPFLNPLHGDARWARAVRVAQDVSKNM